MFAIGIVAHPDRELMALSLGDQVNAQVIRFDDEEMGCEWNHRKTWENVARLDREWSVVLEDDAIPVPGFLHQLEQALAVAPTEVVSLYLGRAKPGISQRPIRALVDAGVDTPWIIAPRLLHAVGVAIRTPLVPRMLGWVGVSPAVLYPIDRAISHWCMSNKHSVGYTWPSLVDHADAQSTIPGNGDGVGGRHVVLNRRVAWRTGTRTHWHSAYSQLNV